MARQYGRVRIRHKLCFGLVISFTFLPVAGLVLMVSAAEKIDIKDRVFLGVYGWSRGEKFRNPGGVFYYAKRNEIYVADSGNHQILIFDLGGVPAARIRHYVDGKDPGESRPGEPKQVAVNSRGDIFCVDALARYLDVMDYRGRQIKRVYPGELLQMGRDKVGCNAVAVDAADNIYLATGGGESTILVLDRELQLVRQIGAKGEEKGKFLSISGVWVDAASKVYVTDARGEPSVQVFSPEGKLILSFGAHSAGPNNFSLPSGIATDELGNIYVLDSLRHLIAAFTAEGKFVARLSGGFGQRPGDLSYPSGITCDGRRTLFTVEKVGARLQGFKLEITPPKAD